MARILHVDRDDLNRKLTHEILIKQHLVMPAMTPASAELLYATHYDKIDLIIVHEERDLARKIAEVKPARQNVLFVSDFETEIPEALFCLFEHWTPDNIPLIVGLALPKAAET